MNHSLQYWRGYLSGWLHARRHYLSFQFWRGYIAGLAGRLK